MEGGVGEDQQDYIFFRPACFDSPSQVIFSEWI